jgi:transcriptional regulator with XRE-family HTH domain
MLIGELIRATRERHGLTQARLARRIGSDRAYVSRVEAIDLQDIAAITGHEGRDKPPADRGSP